MATSWPIIIERHITTWDIKNNRPIQNGQVLNPHTGIFEIPSQESGNFTGPPCVDLVVTNINVGPALDGTDRFIYSRGAHIASMEEIIAEIGDHVREELFEIVSLNATKFAVIIVINTRRSRGEMSRRLGEMRKRLIERTWERSRKLKDEALAESGVGAISDEDGK